MSNKNKASTPKCRKCKSRTALITGYFDYEVDQEPYTSGIKEESLVEDGICRLIGYKCDKCGYIQSLDLT